MAKDRREYNKKYREANRERLLENDRAYHQKNKEKYRQYFKDRYQANKEKSKEASKKYREEHKERIVEVSEAYYEKNKDAINEKNRQFRKDHPELVLAREKRQYLRRKYGMTLEDYNAMLVSQGGGCAICGEPQEGKSLAVDHDHVTNKVRGLLCEKHNRGLGLFGDSIELLQAAIDYLEMNKGVG